MISSFLLPAFLHALLVSAAPAPYVVTSYVELSIYTVEDYITSGSQTVVAEYTYTNTEDVIPTVTPIPSAISTYTEESIYTHVSIIEIVLPPGSGSEPTIDYAAYSTSLDTIYVVPVTYTAPATCTGENWTFTTTVPVLVPNIVATQLSPVTVSASATTYSYLNYNPTPTTAMIAVLNPTDVDPDDLASASSSYMPYEISYCESPTTYCAEATCTSSSTSVSGDGYGNYNSYNYDTMIQPLILICVLVPVGWILLWLIIGLLESWASFKGLMLGKQRKRGLPYAWCCVNILFLCWVGPTYKAKSVEEQSELLEKWKAMKMGEKLKLWLKWGFRWKYPDMIGPEPDQSKRPFRQGCL
jgi:hypothetical protein